MPGGQRRHPTHPPPFVGLGRSASLPGEAPSALSPKTPGPLHPACPPACMPSSWGTLARLCSVPPLS
eukprot:1865764-Alexandrium_andersonii.AAC.1